MQKIQRFPQGFLGLIGNTSGGTTPGTVADSIVGTIDTRPFFDFNAQNRSFITGTNSLVVGAFAFAFPTAAQIADGRNVFIHAVSLQLGPVIVAEQVTGRLYIGYQGAGGIPVDAGPIALAATQAGLFGQFFEKPIQIRCSDSISFYTFARTGLTPISYGLTVLWSQY